jgi:glycosyltransferase involved in cell wall biosynthesis
MNIWYLSAHDQPKGRSSRTYDFSLELLKRGHRVTMFTNSYDHWTHTDFLGADEKWRVEEVDGIRVVWLKTHPYKGNGLGRGLNMISNAWRSLMAARTLTDKPDVVIGPSVPLGTGWAAARLARKYGAAFIFEVRDVWPQALVDDGGLSRNHPVYHAFRSLEKSLYRASQRISATVPFLFNHVSESGSDPKKVVWMPNGVDFQRFKGFDTYDGGTGMPLVVMYVGGFGVAHDVISIVRAAKILKDRGHTNLRFIIVGNGPKRAACEAEAQAAGLTHIEFRDPVPKAQVAQIQTEADILVACVTDSLSYRFGLNLNKLYDYFASSRPVIFSGNAPNDPIAESGAGFSVPPENPAALADALGKLQEMTPQQRVEIGKNGRRYVEENFDMKVLGDRMEELILQARKDRGYADAA